VSNLNAHAGDERAALVMARVGADGNVRITNAFGKTDLVADLVAVGAPSLNGGYVPIDPLRLVDMRNSNTNDRSSMLGPNDTRTFATNAPAGTVAAIVNLTATEATERTWVASFAADTLFPGTSSVNVAPNDTSANLVIVPLSADTEMATSTSLSMFSAGSGQTRAAATFRPSRQRVWSTRAPAWPVVDRCVRTKATRSQSPACQKMPRRSLQHLPA
jgi:hypothetical protein